MKKILVLVVALFVFSQTAEAHEGLVDLTSSSVSCKGISVYQDGSYRVSGRCDGLVYPFETLYNKYVLWGKASTRGEMIRIAEIDRGYFSGSISTTFDSMYVTAEKDGLVRKPSDRQILSGSITPFSFDKSQVTAAPVTTTTTAPVTKTTANTSGATASAGSVVGRIVSSLLVIVLVIVGIAIGASLLFRKRGSVSA